MASYSLDYYKHLPLINMDNCIVYQIVVYNNLMCLERSKYFSTCSNV